MAQTVKNLPAILEHGCMLSRVRLLETPWALQPTRLLCPRSFPGKNTEVGAISYSRGIFPTQGSSPRPLCLLHWQADSLPLHHLEARDSIPGSGRSLDKRWQPTPVFLPGKPHKQRSLAGYSPRGPYDWDMTERLSLSLFMIIPSVKNVV